MDCISMGNEGYVAIVNSINQMHYNNIDEGSPVFQLKNDEMIPVQYFTKPRQTRVQLFNVHNILYMIQTFRSGTAQEKSICPVLKWMDSTFNVFDYLPCNNAMRIEPFVIENQIYIAVANHMDQYRKHCSVKIIKNIFQKN